MKKRRDPLEFVWLPEEDGRPRMQSLGEYRDSHPEVLAQAKKLAREVGGSWQSHFVDLYGKERDRLYAEWGKWHGEKVGLTEPASVPILILEP